jgi:hypothetical protein
VICDAWCEIDTSEVLGEHLVWKLQATATTPKTRSSPASVPWLTNVFIRWYSSSEYLVVLDGSFQLIRSDAGPVARRINALLSPPVQQNLNSAVQDYELFLTFVQTPPTSPFHVVPMSSRLVDEP